MINIKICIGSSCHLKGAPIIVELLQEKIKEFNLNNKINLMGSFCSGHCNRLGVTIIVDDETCIGITKEGFNEFWKKKIEPLLDKEV